MAARKGGKMTQRKRDTGRDVVREVYPHAVAKQWSHAWCIEKDMNFTRAPLGSGLTEKEAWENAAIAIQRARHAARKGGKRGR